MPADAMRTENRDFRLIALIIAVAMFMEQLDATILSTALPSMAPSFDVSPARLSIALTSYLLSLALFIPASGVIADRFGARRIFWLAILTFLLGSILCAHASSLPMLVVSRLIQGAGGAMMVPVGRLLLLHSIQKNDLASAMGWLLTPGLAGQILGPTVGGLIVTYLDWRWIFYINLPIGVFGLWLTYKFIPVIARRKTGPFDLCGFLLCSLALSSLLFGCEGLGRGQNGYAGPLMLLVLGTLSGLGYLWHSRRLQDRAPILDLTLLHIPTFRLAIVAGSLTRITQGALPFLLPLLMQIGLGRSPVESGFLTFAMACGFVAMKPLAAPILRRLSLRGTLVCNSVLSSALCAMCAAFRSEWPHSLIWLVLFLAGLSLSLQITAYNVLCFADIPANRLAAANSLFGTLQQLMLSVGICVATIALSISRTLAGQHGLRPADFSCAILLVTGISLLAGYVNTALPRQNPP